MSDPDSDETTARSFSGRTEYDPGQLAALVLATVFGYLITTPPIYAFAYTNQASQLPLIRRAMDPSYLANDWVVEARTGFSAPKFFYNQFVGSIGELVGLSNAVLLVYVFSIALVLGGMWFFVDELVADRLAATVAVGLLLTHYVSIPVGTPYPPNMSGYSLLKDFLQPSVLANAFVLVGMAYAVKRSYRRSFVAFGIATLIHVSNGFWIALVTGLCIVAVEARTDLRDRNLEAAIRSVPWDAAAIYGAIVSVVVIPLLIANAGSSNGFEEAYIMAWVRHPHHYVSSTWPLLPTLATIAFLLLVTALVYVYRDVIFPDDDRTSFAFTFVLTIFTILFFGGYVFTELVPVPELIKLTPFRTEVYLYVVLYAGLAKLLVVGLKRVGNRTSIDPASFAIGTIFVVVILAIAAWTTPLVLLQLGASPIESDIGVSEDKTPSQSIADTYVHTSTPERDLAETYDWIESNTPEDAVFLAPPSEISFRWETSRARVVNVKSFPFRSDAMVEWEQRMNAVCNAEIRELDRKGLATTCDERFYNMSETEVQRVATTYNASWVLTKNASYSLPLEHTNGEYYVYRV